MQAIDQLKSDLLQQIEAAEELATLEGIRVDALGKRV